MSPAESLRAPPDVLIAEDDGDVRLAVRQLLEGQGYTCAEAADGRAAVEAARQNPPRLVLLDLMMPWVDGFAAARQMRSDPRTRDVPIHCLTALNDAAARRAAREAGCEGFFTKPFSPDELLGAVSAAVFPPRPGDDALSRALRRLGQTLPARVPGREGRWARQLADALAGLEDALRGPAGAAGGCPGDVDWSRPTLARRAAALVRERHRLLGQAGALRAQVRGAAQAFQTAGSCPGAADDWPEPAGPGLVVDFGAIRRSGEELVTALLRHAAGERELLFESVNTDIGVGD